MTGLDDNVAVCCSAEAFFALSDARQAMLERIDGPFKQIACPYCGNGMMVGRGHGELLASGWASHAMCSSCLLEAVKALDAMMPK